MNTGEEARLILKLSNDNIELEGATICIKVSVHNSKRRIEKMIISREALGKLLGVQIKVTGFISINIFTN